MPVKRCFHLYVGNHANKVSVLSMSLETGELTMLQELRFHEHQGRHQAMAMSLCQRFLYVGNRRAPYSIHTYAINGDTGELTHLLESPTAESPTFIIPDRTGRFLLGAHNPPDRKRRDGYLTVAPIYEGLVLAPHQVIHTPPKTHSIMTDPSNRFAFAPACDADVVGRYRFDVATGLLNADGLSPLYMRPRSGPRHHRYHPNGRFMYLNNEYDGTICCYEYDARNGAVSEMQIADARPIGMDKEANVRTSELRFTPDGKWLYTGSRASGRIIAFRVDGVTGRLTRAGEYEVSSDPRGFNIDPYGRYLVHSGDLSNELASYRIDAETGALSKVAELDVDGPNYVNIIKLQ